MLCLLLALLPVTPAPERPALEVARVSRSAFASAQAADADFADRVEEGDADSTPGGEWTAAPEAELFGPAGEPAARGQAYHESELGGASLSFSLDASAETAGLHGFAGAEGGSTIVAALRLARPARYAVRAGAECAAPDGAARVGLNGRTGTVFVVEALPGRGAARTEHAGWIGAGTWVLEGAAHASAGGSPGVPATGAANAELELVLLPLADFDLDGEVTAGDRRAFAAAFRRGELTADFDRDGRVTTLDREGFEAAWASSGAR